MKSLRHECDNNESVKAPYSAINRIDSLLTCIPNFVFSTESTNPSPKLPRLYAYVCNLVSNSDVIPNLDTAVTAESLDMTSDGDEAILKSGSEVNVTGNFNMDAYSVSDCDIHSSATINAGTETGNCL